MTRRTTTKLTQSNRGRGLEVTVVASQRGLIRVRKMTAGAKWLAGGRAVQVLGPPDFVGCVVGSGRAICFDAKQSADPRRFALSLVRPHQLDYLAEQGEAGAVAGVLAEATARRRYYWVGWAELAVCGRRGLRSIPWDAVPVVDLGDSGHAIRFDLVPGVVTRSIEGLLAGAKSNQGLS